MAVTENTPTPYAPASAILGVIERVRSRGLPNPITTEVLARASVSQSLIPRTLQALQALELIDEDGRQTEALSNLRAAPEAEYQARLAEWVKRVYADIFNYVDPATDDETAIRDAFRSYHPIGQQSRMVTLFQGLCAAAGLMPERQPSTPRQRSSAPRQQRPARRASEATGQAGRRRREPSGDTGLPPSLAGLLATLPLDAGWTPARRQQFITAFEAVLDLCVPIVEEPNAGIGNGDQ